jgi:hypothetical protein
MRYELKMDDTVLAVLESEEKLDPASAFFTLINRIVEEVVDNDGAREAGSDGGVSGGAAPVRGGQGAAGDDL